MEYSKIKKLVSIVVKFTIKHKWLILGVLFAAVAMFIIGYKYALLIMGGAAVGEINHVQKAGDKLGNDLRKNNSNKQKEINKINKQRDKKIEDAKDQVVDIHKVDPNKLANKIDEYLSGKNDTEK